MICIRYKTIGTVEIEEDAITYRVTETKHGMRITVLTKLPEKLAIEIDRDAIESIAKRYL